MARSIAICIFALLAMSLFISSLFISCYAGGEGSVTLEGCPSECDRRCSKASNHERCLLYCNMCCDKCLCVPSETFGNKEECACYNDWKNKKGGPKCP